MALTYLTVVPLLVVSGYCSIINTRSEDIKPLLEDILKRLDEKEARIVQLEETVRIQQTLIQQQQALIQQQQTNMDDQNHRIIALEREVLVQKQIVSEVKDSNDDEESEAEHTISGELDSKYYDVFQNNASIIQIKRESGKGRGSGGLRVRQVENETPVAFLASLSDHSHHLGSEQSIVFDRVVTNIGGAYNEHIGAFVAPVSGVYVFSATLLSYGEVNAHFEFKKNANMVVRLYHNGVNSPHDTTSSTIVLQLAKGDDVIVTNSDTDKDLYGDHYSTFSGFLLQEIFDDTALVGK